MKGSRGAGTRLSSRSLPIQPFYDSMIIQLSFLCRSLSSVMQTLRSEPAPRCATSLPPLPHQLPRGRWQQGSGCRLCSESLSYSTQVTVSATEHCPSSKRSLCSGFELRAASQSACALCPCRLQGASTLV